MKTFQELAKHILKEEGIKILHADVENGEYSEYAIYINRIANGNKPKFRVLKPGERVRNCIKITFDHDRIKKEYLQFFIEGKCKMLAFLSHGSCHKFLNIRTCEYVLSGIVGKNGQPTDKAKLMLNQKQF